MKLKEFEQRMFNAGAKLNEHNGDIVITNDDFTIALSKDRDGCGIGFPEVFVVSGKGFITEYLYSIFENPEEMLINIIWKDYLIPNNIMTQEEYNEVLLLSKTKCFQFGVNEEKQ